MPIDNKSGIGSKNNLPTSAWDDIAQNSFESGQAHIYEQASDLWDFYYQIYNGGIGGWISNNYFFHVHDVRRILLEIGGTATLEIEKLLVQVLPFLNFALDPLMEPDDPRFYFQSTINESKLAEWEIVEKSVNKRIFELKQEFRREGEEYFAFHWKKFR